MLTVEDKDEFTKIAKTNNIKTIFKTDDAFYFPLDGVLIRYERKRF